MSDTVFQNHIALVGHHDDCIISINRKLLHGVTAWKLKTSETLSEFVEEGLNIEGVEPA